MKENKKIDKMLGELLSRQDYLVVQGNDLAKAFGGLSSFEHRVLDYCFSFVTRESSLDDVYKVFATDIIKHFGLNASGQNYNRIGQAFKRLNENTALYLPIVEDDGTEGILMTQLFSYIKFFKNGLVEFKFSEFSAPYVLDLKEKYYSFRLGDLAKIRGKYALILLKLWEAKRIGKQKKTILSGSIDEWKQWFLEKDKELPTGRFYREVIVRSIDELEHKIPCEFYVTTFKRGRVVTGYEIAIIDMSI